MVNALAGYLIVLATLGQNPPAPEPIPDADFRAALKKGNYPWYDADKDSASVVNIPQDSDWPDWPAWSLPTSLGQVLVWMFFGIGLLLLVAMLVWLWRLYSPSDQGKSIEPKRPSGTPSRVESLPEGMRREFESSDPWEEAIRRKNRGDLTGAVVCLFAHQLLTLMRLGLVRLAPGRTGRQLLRSVSDAEFRGLVMPTLRLFEVVYYGHRTPTPEEFASVWAGAEAFERRVARWVVQ